MYLTSWGCELHCDQRQTASTASSFEVILQNGYIVVACAHAVYLPRAQDGGTLAY